MLSDLTDPNAIRKAAAEFDELGREEFLRRYGYGRAIRYFVRIDDRLYDSKALVGAAHGVQFPDRGALSPSEFSGGEQTVRPTLERLGFNVIDRRAEVLEAMTSLREAIEAVCDLLHLRNQGSEDFDVDFMDRIIKQALPQLVGALGEDRAVVRGRTGIGTAADVPWVGLFPPGDAASAQQGFYVVYLFAKDGSAACECPLEWWDLRTEVRH